jgi:hypothetical protein
VEQAVEDAVRSDDLLGLAAFDAVVAFVLCERRVVVERAVEIVAVPVGEADGVGDVGEKRGE